MNQPPRNLPIYADGVSVYICRTVPDTGRAGEYLVMRRAGHESFAGLWQQVTGAIHENETAVEAAVRELHEETGLSPRELYSANMVHQYYAPDRDGIMIMPVFLAFVTPDTEEVTLSEEHDEFRWVPVGRAGEVFTFSQQRDRLVEIEENFVARPPSEYLRLIPSADVAKPRGRDHV
ncbi:MAG: NUDIX hydrolase [Phycisphaerae bacterium]